MGILQNKYRSYAVFAVGLLALALAPAAASAQQVDPTTSQYRDSLTQVSAGGSGPPAGGEASAETTSGLPFTGLDVGLLAVVAVGLLVAGFLLHRQSRSNA
jgi:hypothetical protein